MKPRWSVVEAGGCLALQERNKLVACFCNAHGTYGPRERHRANLAALAPELLSVCLDIFSNHERYKLDADNTPYCNYCGRQLDRSDNGEVPECLVNDCIGNKLKTVITKLKGK